MINAAAAKNPISELYEAMTELRGTVAWRISDATAAPFYAVATVTLPDLHDDPSFLSDDQPSKKAAKAAAALQALTFLRPPFLRTAMYVYPRLDFFSSIFLIWIRTTAQPQHRGAAQSH